MTLPPCPLAAPEKHTDYLALVHLSDYFVISKAPSTATVHLHASDKSNVLHPKLAVCIQNNRNPHLRLRAEQHK